MKSVEEIIVIEGENLRISHVRLE